MTEQRRRRAQATLGPRARPQRQAAQPIGQKLARAYSSLACMPRQSQPPPPLLLPEAPLTASSRPQLRVPASFTCPPFPPLFPEAFAVSRDPVRRDSRLRPRGRALSVWAPGGRWRLVLLPCRFGLSAFPPAFSPWWARSLHGGIGPALCVPRGPPFSGLGEVVFFSPLTRPVHTVEIGPGWAWEFHCSAAFYLPKLRSAWPR